MEEWLASFGLAQYVDSFKENEVTYEMLFSLTQEDLKECGMTSLGHRKTFFTAVDALRNPPSPTEKATHLPMPADEPASLECLAPSSIEPTARVADSFVTEEIPVAMMVEAPIEEQEFLLASPEVMEQEMHGQSEQTAPEKKPEVPLTAVQRFWKFYQRASGGSFMLSLVVHLVILIIGIYLVVSSIAEERKISFGGGGGPEGPKSETQHKVKKKANANAPAPTKRITTTSSVAAVALPDMPNMNMSMGPTVAGSMGTGGFGAAGGLSGGGGGGGGGGSGKGIGKGFSNVTFFGLSAGGKGTGIPGTFYDLKQTTGKKPTGMNPAKWTEVVQTFLRDWNTITLSKYFKGPKQLLLNQMYIYNMAAEAGPKAFELEKEVQPKMWVVHYKGQVIAPKTGRFRFVGRGDDILAVRFNGQIVLEYGQLPSVHWKTQNAHYTYQNLKIPNKRGLMPGDWINVSQGQTYPIEILIGERPGGGLEYYLMIEEEGVKYGGAPNAPLLPLFRVGGEPVPEINAKGYPFAKDGPVWKAKPSSLSSLR